MGKQQQFQLGLFMRERYATLRNDTYSEDDIYIQSSDIDRTIMSAEAFLAGLYTPDKPTDIWNTHLPWQPIPVHTLPIEYDHLIIADRQCDAFSENYDELMKSDKIKEFDQKHRDLFDFLSLHSGDVVQTMSDTVPIRDTLKIEAVHNRT